NLRASRETELAAEYPIHVVCAWIGNTEMIAAKHYLQVTDDYFRLATREVGAAKSGAEALQNPVQQGAAPSGTDSQETTEALPEPGFPLISSGIIEEDYCTLVPPRGLEPLS